MEAIDTGATALVLISAALVFIMTPGVAFFYGGLVRRKNVLSIMMQSFVSLSIVTLIWLLGGFSLAFGEDVAGLIGDLRYFGLAGVGLAPHPTYGPTIPFLAFFAFQQMFAIITPVLITGAFADRVNFRSYLIFLIFWSVLVYIPLVHWTWGGGFLARLGVVDYAGGIVVHISAGFAALASIFVVGKRKLLPGEKLAPHNLTFVALGTGLLWFGWFGFNAGSALTSGGEAALAFVNTDIAASLVTVIWLLLSWARDGRPSMANAMTGSVAGLVAITPAAGYVRPWAAAVIGLISGLICYAAVRFRIRMDWDDAVDVWACHGVGGACGLILAGVFAGAGGASGLIAGNWRQALIQLAAALIAIVFSFGATLAILKVMDHFGPVRVPEPVEVKGLDEGLLEEAAYTL